MADFELDKHSAVFTYEQFIRSVLTGHNHATMPCPFNDGHKLVMFKSTKGYWKWWCYDCKFGGEMEWGQSHVVFVKDPGGG